MKSTEEYLSVLRSEKESLFRKYQISNLGLFGSVARHEQREDIDIYYESSHSIDNFMTPRVFDVFNSHGANHESTYRRYAYRYDAKKERGTSMEVFARNESHKGAMMNV